MPKSLTEFLRSSTCLKSIGWVKFLASGIVAFALIIILIFYSSVFQTMKKSSNLSSDMSKFCYNLLQFQPCFSISMTHSLKCFFLIIYFLLLYLELSFALILSILILLVHAACSFIFIIGTLNVSFP